MRLDAVPFRWLFAFALLLALGACGGGGGGGGGEIRTISPGDSVLQGTWQRRITYDGVQSGAQSLNGSEVPIESEVAAFTTATVAVLLIDRFPNKNVAVNGNRVTVTDPGTGQVLNVTVNIIWSSSYAGCGSCVVGTAVTIALTVNITETGTLDHQTFGGSRDSTLIVRFTRTA